MSGSPKQSRFLHGLRRVARADAGLPPVPIGELNTTTEDLVHREAAAPLHARSPAVQHRGTAGDVRAARVEHGGPAARDEVCRRFGDEATLYRLAGQLEQERPWKDKKPPICA